MTTSGSPVDSPYDVNRAAKTPGGSPGDGAGGGIAGGSTATSPPVGPPPRVGGTKLYGSVAVPWTGGSNIPTKGVREPTSLQAHRPTEFRAAKQNEDTLKRGLDDEACLYPADAICKVGSGKSSLLTWLDNVRRELEERGMDTQFRVPASCTGRGLIEGDKERYLFEDWGTVDREDVTMWVNWLLTYGDSYDRYNLKMSFRMIQASISTQMWGKVSNNFRLNGGDPNVGPELLVQLIEDHRLVSCSAIQSLVEEIRKMKIGKFPGENVEEFGKLLWDKTSIVIGSTHKPDNIGGLVVQCFLTGTVFEFKVAVTELLRKANKKLIPDNQIHREVIVGLKDRYNELVDANAWDPKKIHKENPGGLAGAVAEEPAEPVIDTAAALVAQIQQLTQAVASMQQGRQSDGKGEIRCHLCNKTGHMKSQCPNKDKSALRTAPKPGEPETRTRNNVLEKFCVRCKRWNSGDRGHTTSEHKVGFKTGGGAAPAAGLLGSVPDSAKPSPAPNNPAPEADFFYPTLHSFGGFMGTVPIDHGRDIAKAAHVINRMTGLTHHLIRWHGLRGLSSITRKQASFVGRLIGSQAPIIAVHREIVPNRIRHLTATIPSLREWGPPTAPNRTTYRETLRAAALESALVASRLFGTNDANETTFEWQHLSSNYDDVTHTHPPFFEDGPTRSRRLQTAPWDHRITFLAPLAVRQQHGGPRLEHLVHHLRTQSLLPGLMAAEGEREPEAPIRPGRAYDFGALYLGQDIGRDIYRIAWNLPRIRASWSSPLRQVEITAAVGRQAALVAHRYLGASSLGFEDPHDATLGFLRDGDDYSDDDSVVSASADEPHPYVGPYNIERGHEIILGQVEDFESSRHQAIRAWRIQNDQSHLNAAPFQDPVMDPSELESSVKSKRPRRLSHDEAWCDWCQRITNHDTNTCPFRDDESDGPDDGQDFSSGKHRHPPSGGHSPFDVPRGSSGDAGTMNAAGMMEVAGAAAGNADDSMEVAGAPAGNTNDSLDAAGIVDVAGIVDAAGIADAMDVAGTMDAAGTTDAAGISDSKRKANTMEDAGMTDAATDHDGDTPTNPPNIPRGSPLAAKRNLLSFKNRVDIVLNTATGIIQWAHLKGHAGQP